MVDPFLTFGLGALIGTAIFVLFVVQGCTTRSIIAPLEQRKRLPLPAPSPSSSENRTQQKIDHTAQKNGDKKPELCMVCHKVMKSTIHVQLECEHQLHFECWKELMKLEHNTCPICGVQINLD